MTSMMTCNNIITSSSPKKTSGVRRMGSKKLSPRKGSKSVDTGSPEGWEVFVGRVPSHAQESMIRDLAKDFNPKSVRLLLKVDHSSCRCGFVVFDEIADAQGFIKQFDGQVVLNGRYPLNVRFADGKSRKKVFIGGLAQGTTEEDLRNIAQQYGTIAVVQILDRNPRALCGFVTFATGAQSDACIRDLHDKLNADGSKKYVVRLAKSPDQAKAQGRPPRRGNSGMPPAPQWGSPASVSPLSLPAVSPAMAPAPTPVFDQFGNMVFAQAFPMQPPPQPMQLVAQPPVQQQPQPAPSSVSIFYLSQLPSDVQIPAVLNLVSAFGPVLDIQLFPDASGAGAAAAITLADANSVMAAVQSLNGAALEGYTLPLAACSPLLNHLPQPQQQQLVLC